MKTKVAKKKKTTKPKVKAKKVAKPKGRSLLERKHAQRSRLALFETTRSMSRDRSIHRTGYYAMGALALGVGIIFGVWQMFRGTNDTTSPLLIQEISNLHSEVDRQDTENRASNNALEKEFQKTQSMSFTDRIQFWSLFIQKNKDGRQRIISAVANHHVDDNVPLVPHTYDCTTYVETVAALAQSSNADAFLKNLIAIRYKDGQPNFMNRNHFPEADWIPNNLRANILTDITGKVAEMSGLIAQEEKKQIDREKWLADQLHKNMVSRNIASVAEKSWAKSVPAKVTYVEISQIKKVLDQIPTGTILNLVHKDDGKHSVLITHQGFVIREGDQVLLRHASRGGHIRTNNLYSYLHDLLRKQHSNTKWPLIGVNLIQINTPQTSASTSDSNRLSESM